MARPETSYIYLSGPRQGGREQTFKVITPGGSQAEAGV